MHLDPRVTTPALALSQLTSLTKEMYDGATKTHAASEQARALAAKLDGAGDDAAAVKAAVTTIAPPPPAGGGRGGRGGGGRGGAVAVQTLDGATNALIGAAMAMQNAEAAPTAREIAACAEARRQAAAVMAKWTKITAVDLPALNAKRKAAGQPPIVAGDGDKK